MVPWVVLWSGQWSGQCMYAGLPPPGLPVRTSPHSSMTCAIVISSLCSSSETAAARTIRRPSNQGGWLGRPTTTTAPARWPTRAHLGSTW